MSRLKIGPVLCSLWCCILWSSFAASPVRGHPISIMEANAFVTRTKLTLQLTIFADDLYVFHELEANENDLLERDQLLKAMQSHKKFLLDKVIIRDAEGKRVTGKVTSVKTPEMPEEGVDISDLMLYLVEYELEYSFAEPPKFLTFSQEITDENFLRPSEMKLWVKQSGSGAAFTAVLRPGDHETMRLDWEHPPLSEAATDEEWEQWIQKQREKTLGITSYSSVYSFIYITDREVRHEVLVPVMTLATIIDMPRQDEAFLEVEEQQAVRPAIEKFFRKLSKVEIDGVTVPPVFDRVDFFGLDLRDFAQRPERQQVSMASGRVGVIMSYSVKSPPGQVHVTWQEFNSSIRRVDSSVFAWDKPSKMTFSRFREDNTFRWTAPDRPPLPAIEQVAGVVPDPPKVSLPLSFLGCLAGMLIGWKLRARCVFGRRLHADWLVAAAGVVGGLGLWPIGGISFTWPLAGRPQLAEAKAEDIFRSLHQNIYRAFDYRSEDDVYDALAASIDGTMLRQVYLQIRKGLQDQEQGGAVARVSEVRQVKGQRLAPENDKGERVTWPGFRYQSTWTVSGAVEHWGHIHERTNQYQAVFDVEVRDPNPGGASGALRRAWKITNMEIQEDKRVSSRLRLRKF